MKRGRYPVFAFLLLAASTGALAASDLQVAVSAGLNGASRSGRWTFLRLNCANQGDPIDGVAVVQGYTYSGDELAEVYETPVLLPRGSRKEFLVYTPCDPRTSYYNVTLRNGNRVLFEEKVGTATSKRTPVQFWSVTAEQCLAAYLAQGDDAPRELRFDSSGQSAVPLPRIQVTTLSPPQLPDRWIGFDAADVVIAHADIFQSARDDRLGALLDWVGAGGQLVVMPRANDTGRLHSDWAKIFGMQIATAEPFVAGDVFLGRYGSAPPNALRAVWEGVAHTKLLGDESGPLLSRRRHGIGTISFCAFDLTSPAWRGWRGANGLWRDLLLPGFAPRSIEGTENMGGGYPYNWHSQNIINALRQIPALKPPSFLMLGGYLCVYLFVMVGVNYFVLRRLDKKEWSLVTFPVIAILFGVGAYWSGYLIRGSTSMMNQINVVELAAGERLGVVRTFFGLFSARRLPCLLTFPRESFPQYLSFSYGDPSQVERGFSPMRVTEADGQTARVPINVWSMRTFQSDGLVEWPKTLDGEFRLVESKQGLLLEGWVKNQTDIRFVLNSVWAGANCHVANRALGPHQRLDVKASLTAMAQPGSFVVSNDQALNPAGQWWYLVRHQPGWLYFVWTTDLPDAFPIGMNAPRVSRQQKTLLILRVPVKTDPTQKTFGPKWWEPVLLRNEVMVVYPNNWGWKNGFNLHRGSVTMRYQLLGHVPGRRLTALSVTVSSQLAQNSVSVLNRRDQTWKMLPTGRATTLDPVEFFDDLHGTVEVRMDAGQGNQYFQPQFVQVAGEVE